MKFIQLAILKLIQPLDFPVEEVINPLCTNLSTFLSLIFENDLINMQR